MHAWDRFQGPQLHSFIRSLYQPWFQFHQYPCLTPSPKPVLSHNLQVRSQKSIGARSTTCYHPIQPNSKTSCVATYSWYTWSITKHFRCWCRLILAGWSSRIERARSSWTLHKREFFDRFPDTPVPLFPSCQRTEFTSYLSFYRPSTDLETSDPPSIWLDQQLQHGLPERIDLWLQSGEISS